ncbi:hypothetical protein D3C74_441490 [compost metagenome]
MYKLSQVAYALVAQDDVPRGTNPRSAYDALVNKISDCDSDAQVISAVFDAAGYSTAIIASPNHANMAVRIDDKWYEPFSSSFIESL